MHLLPCLAADLFADAPRTVRLDLECVSQRKHMQVGN